MLPISNFQQCRNSTFLSELQFTQNGVGSSSTAHNNITLRVIAFSFVLRRCSACKKKRSLRTNSFFTKFPKVSLGELVMLVYLWSVDQSRKHTARMMDLNNNLVCRVFRSLEDVCSIDIGRNPIIPFPGRCLVKIDESKFNHKAKVRFILCCCVL